MPTCLAPSLQHARSSPHVANGILINAPLHACYQWDFHKMLLSPMYCSFCVLQGHAYLISPVGTQGFQRLAAMHNLPGLRLYQCRLHHFYHICCSLSMHAHFPTNMNDHASTYTRHTGMIQHAYWKRQSHITVHVPLSAMHAHTQTALLPRSNTALPAHHNIIMEAQNKKSLSAHNKQSRRWGCLLALSELHILPLAIPHLPTTR